MSTFCERAAHSVNRMFSMYYVVFNFVCCFGGSTFVLIAQVPGHCLQFALKFANMPIWQNR